MNTIHHPHEPSYPSLQSVWHKMIRRSRAGDRSIALILCRAAFREQNGGCFPALTELSDDELCSRIGLTARQLTRLRGESPLWRWNGKNLELFFYGSPVEEGLPTPSGYGKRRARIARRKREREQRFRRRMQLGTVPYSLPDDAHLLAADEDEETENSDK